MSKKRIQNYVFLPGVANSSNAFPNAYSLLQANKEFIKAEAMQFIANSIATDTAANLYPNAVTLLTNNKTFLQNEITAWIAARVAEDNPPYSGYTYNAEKCRRDVGYIIDAYIYDLRYGGNTKTIQVVKQYWLGGVPQVDGDRTPEVNAHIQLGSIITNFILTRSLYGSEQSPASPTQNTSGNDGEAGTGEIITSLSQIVASVIQNGLSVLPAIVFPTYNFAQYIYDLEKCQRDTNFVLEAYFHDLRYGGNVRTRFIASRYWEGSKPQIDGDRTPEIETHQFIRNLINTYILPQTAYTPLQGTINRVLNPSTIYEPNSTARITTLSTILINVITNGLGSLPAVANGVTQIKLQGRVVLEEVLLITNTTTNTILYNFSDPNLTAYADHETAYNSNGNYRDDDYPAFLQIADYVTTITLNADTSTCSATDDIQIFVEQQEQRTRPYDFGTDAIERNRVAAPQSMLDADFEYGLQPTKWQAIGMMRGYPSVYEVPGTDTQVLSVVTDASAGTDGIGQSLITVTTSGPHGFSVGTPITIRALANTVLGFSRAEGTFIVTSVPTNNTFTYYSVSKVGTTPGEVLATTYTQLRQGAFYTGASIGVPAFGVLTNGTETTITTVFETPEDTDQLAFIGNPPTLGSPLVGDGIVPGTQVTGVVGPGGIAVTTDVNQDAAIGATTFSVTDATGILEGMAIDNGTGGALFVTNVAGTNISLTGQLTAQLRGDARTYINLAGSNLGSSGVDATFDVARESGVYSSVIVNTAGTGYAENERIVILGEDLGGVTPTNNLTITITSVDVDGAITGLTYSGTSVSGDENYTGLTETSSTGAGTVLYNSLPQTSTTGSGTNSAFNVTRSVSGYVVTLSTPGTGYNVSDNIVIAGTVLGGASPTNDLTITVTAVQATYPGLTQDSTSGSGTDAIFGVIRQGTTYSVALGAAGTGYAPGDTVTILGTQVGGASPANNVTITINTVDTGGEILTYTVSGTATGSGGVYTFTSSGTAVTGPTTGTGATFDISRIDGVYTATVSSPGASYQATDTLTFSGTLLGGTSPSNDLTITISTVDGNGGILTFTQSGTGVASDATFIDVAGTNIDPTGSNATFNISRSGGSYTGVVINLAGTGYFLGDKIKVLGTALSGDSPDNDATITVTGVSGGAITTAEISGTAVSGDSIDFYSALTFSQATSTAIPAETEITAEAIAKITVEFPTPHGLVPGTSIVVTIVSTGDNHQLAAGPYYVEEVPNSTTIIYTARSPGEVDETTLLAGIVYARPDSYFIHRPYDGGVLLGTGGPQHGAQAIRMSKKYIRYQSGKGIMYTTGALFAPSYNLKSLSATGTVIGSFITVETDDTDHGCQVGGVIRLIGIETAGYNGEYEIVDIVNERTFRVQANTLLANTQATLGIEAQMSIVRWHGATVRAGCFDDQNGMFWQYDGQYLAVGRRTSTFQLAGVANIARDANLVTGRDTRFRDQVKSGDKIVIKGMTHVVTKVISNTSMTVSPDYRGAVDAVESKVCLIQDIIIRQEHFNIDRLDGTGPSGYNLDISKMQMIGLQYSWYGAGFIDFMLRGSDGNYVFAHRIRNSNVNTEAFMRTGNLPVRYEVINESASARLASSITAGQTTLTLDDATYFPNESGVVLIDDELIAFTGKSGNTLTGCTRAAPMTNFVGGAQRTFTGSAASTHEFSSGVILISNTISPIISHWGSAFLTDGLFDEDRGYIFSYAATNVSVSTTKQTAFLIRLAPSVSNAIVGDLGERELLNRAQLLLKGIEITADTGTGGIVVEGVLNPQNYPINPSDISWSGLQGAAQGGQPSFAQIAPGGSAKWSTGAQTTATATTSAFLTGSITLRAPYGNSTFNGDRRVWITTADYNTYLAQGLATGQRISGTGIPANNTISSIANWGVVNGVSYVFITMSLPANANTSGQQTATVTKTYPISNTSTILYQKASWEASSARAGTEVSDPLFPAATFVSTATLTTYFSTQHYVVTFSQTSTSTAITPGTTTTTFKFGAPPYALPGETVFSFIAQPGASSLLDLSELKELTNTTLGGRGTYPNGPDVLAINVYKAAGSNINCNIILRWGEAQA
jgi:hypothetical protein